MAGRSRLKTRCHVFFEKGRGLYMVEATMEFLYILKHNPLDTKGWE